MSVAARTGVSGQLVDGGILVAGDRMARIQAAIEAGDGRGCASRLCS